MVCLDLFFRKRFLSGNFDSRNLRVRFVKLNCFVLLMSLAPAVSSSRVLPFSMAKVRLLRLGMPQTRQSVSPSPSPPRRFKRLTLVKGKDKAKDKGKDKRKRWRAGALCRPATWPPKSFLSLRDPLARWRFVARAFFSLQTIAFFERRNAPATVSKIEHFQQAMAQIKKMACVPPSD